MQRALTYATGFWPWVGFAAKSVMRVAEKRHDLDCSCAATFLQLALDPVECQVRHLEQHQAAGAQTDDLPAQPVTRTHLPLMLEPNSLELGGTGSRPSRSLTSIPQLVDLRLARDQVREIGERLDVHPEGF